MAAQPLLRIGSGHQIDIWTEPWLPNNEEPWIQSTWIPGLEATTVNGLFATRDRLWDLDILRDIFSERDMNLIMQIPLGR